MKKNETTPKGRQDALQKRTKRYIADSLEEMMKDRPLADIRVTDLCKECGVHRSAFYYHFQDKYDVVTWIFLEDWKECSAKGADFTERMGFFLELLKEKNAFYCNALSVREQNSLMESMADFIVSTTLEEIRENTGTDRLDEDVIVSVYYFCFGTLGLIEEWLCHENSAMPALKPEHFTAFLPKILTDLYKE